MKEDYLWDKTGKDPEIERLENALQQFCYNEIMPPATFAGKVLPFKSEKSARSNGVFSFRLAAAACVTFAVIALGVWLQISKNKTELEQGFAEAVAPQTEVASASKPIAGENIDSAGNKFDSATERKNAASIKSASRKTFQPVRKIVPVTFRRETSAKNNKIAGQKVELEAQTVRLTKAEKYAYNQLLLALSITGSQLKLVQDKIVSVEEQPAAPKTEQ